ncbi:hypothetical protein FJR11_04355 [Anabaena sp. UHCC 0187]|uniref:hypothetical protein n=1 Tax=Anabaena sp. UHCC 0187 TaxID=2590018 RepID=UPI0014460D1A|nr:hypothetical protein [Anabaena sp. UHCC 0187]MTJ11839.1 hypothetical protein [Anabaena sp. UHCC 0187]
MSNLIVILTQIIFIVLVLRVIFSQIDRVVAAYRKRKSNTSNVDTPRSKVGSTRPDKPRWGKIQKSRQVRDERNKRLSQLNRQASSKSRLSGHSWNQLLTKVQGDTATAERLINHLKIKHPGETDRWYVEKAIFDLERDKGRY